MDVGLAPEWTEMKSPRGEISRQVESVTTYKSFLIDMGNFTPGQNLRCDEPLRVKKVELLYIPPP